MGRVIPCLTLLFSLAALPALAQPIPEDQLCLNPGGIGVLEKDFCGLLPGERREIKPSQLPLHLNDGLIQLRVVSDNKPDEPYKLSSLYKNDTVIGLELYREGSIDLSPLATMQTLRRLDLSIDAAKALNQLADTPPATVRDLRLYAPRDVLDLSALASWTNLRVLNITALGVTGQEALANLPHLQDVNFDLGQETDLSVLANAKDLKVLYVRGSLGRTVLSDLSFLADLTKLEILSLNTNAITVLSPLSGLTKLRTLVLSGNTGVTDISVLQNMPGLVNLQLRETGITDLSVLRGMKDLQILWLDRTPIADISPLSETPALWGLELSRTNVTDLSPLKGLQLRHLNLFKTQVSDVSVLDGMPLQSVNLVGSQVTDISAIHPKASVRR